MIKSEDYKITFKNWKKNNKKQIAHFFECDQNVLVEK